MSDYSFSTHLVDGFDLLYKRTEEILKTTAEVGNWFKKISAAEDSYAKAMLKITSSAKSKKKIGSVSTTEMGTTKQAWESFHANLENISSLHASFSQQLQNDVATRIANFVNDKTAVRKKLVLDGTKITNELKAYMAALQKAKLSYDSKCKDADTAQQAFQKAKSDGNIKPKKLNELNGKASKALDNANQADKEYQKALQRANDKQSRFYCQEMPSLLEIFQHFEEERLQFLKEMFEKAAELYNAFPSCVSTTAEAIQQAAQNIQVKADIQEFIESAKTGISAPAPIQYEPYESDNPNFSTNISPPTQQSQANTAPVGVQSVPNSTPTPSAAQPQETPKEYGLSDVDDNLGAVEKAAKIRVQLEELTETIRAETKSKKGLEKLVKFYASEPLSQEKAKGELEEQKQKIATLKDTRAQLENLLGELTCNDGDTVGYDEEEDEDGFEEVCIQARALFPYEATNDTELSFQENDLLTITQQDESGWWFAELEGRSGFVPRNFLEIKE